MRPETQPPQRSRAHRQPRPFVAPRKRTAIKGCPDRGDWAIETGYGYRNGHLIDELAGGLTVIIPHLGFLNGGFDAIAEAGLWERETVWADTALAARTEIREYIRRYGHRRLMFGSDFPFGCPPVELDKVRSLKLTPDVEAAVLRGNFIRLQSQIRRLGAPA